MLIWTIAHTVRADAVAVTDAAAAVAAAAAAGYGKRRVSGTLLCARQ